MTNKSKKDLYSIHEFSKISGVEASTLRYWDDIGIFSPIKREPENNYRYYSLAQVLALNFVTTLSDLGIPLKTIAALKNERDSEDFLKILEDREEELDMELRLLRLRSSIIHTRKRLIRSGLKVDEQEIAVKHLEERKLIVWPRNEYKEGETFIEPLARFIKKSGERQINLSFPVGGFWDSMDRFIAAPSCPDHFFSIDPVGTYSQSNGNYLVGYQRGYYGEMGDLPQRMEDFVAANAVKVSGKLYTVYLIDETCSQDPDQYLAQSFVAVKK